VNFVGHIAIGVAVDGSPSDTTFLLGTALPDFAAMARLKLDRTRSLGTGSLRSGSSLGTGMQLHHDTDAVFHRQGWFLDLERDLLDELTAAGVPRGGALACAHVGVELLLDGELLRTQETADAVLDVYGSLASPPAVALAVVDPARRERWGEHLTGIATRLDPFLYGDPASVAQRLHRITSSRPRLAFEREHVAAVTALLAGVQPRIAASAPDVLAQVTAALR
jgi:hypothetical protein